MLTFRERVQLLAASREEAMTDALTGLGNRRRFIMDMERELASLGETDQLALVVFDLDGFKAYNDSFGHAAGDTLLNRVGRPSRRARWQAAGPRTGSAATSSASSRPLAYVGLGSVIERAVEALTEEGEGFAVTLLLRLGARSDRGFGADRGAANRGRPDVHAQAAQHARARSGRASTCCVSVLQERDSLLAHHLADVAALAEAVSRRLDVPPEQLQTIRQAAELHDVGKLAIPEEILAKPGPLTRRTSGSSSGATR